MKRFEYRREYISNPPGEKTNEALDWLNNLGQEGWMVVSIAGGYENNTMVLIWLMRELP